LFSKVSHKERNVKLKLKNIFHSSDYIVRVVNTVQIKILTELK